MSVHTARRQKSPTHQLGMNQRVFAVVVVVSVVLDITVVDDEVVVVGDNVAVSLFKTIWTVSPDTNFEVYMLHNETTTLTTPYF